MEMQTWAARVARGWLAAAGALLLAVACGAGSWLRVEWIIALAGAVIAIAAARVWARRQSLAATAVVIDRLGQTRDRWQTALALSAKSEHQPAQGEAGSMAALALRECAEWVRGRDFRALLPWRLPREVPFLVVPIIALALLHWDARTAAEARRAEAAAAGEEVAGTVKELRALAGAVAKANQQSGAEELEHVAEALRRSTERLQTAATDRAAAEKAALRELSALEALVEEMRRARDAALSPEERQALARALEAQPATQPAAEAMKAGDLAEAARRLEEAAKQLAQKGDAADAEQTERSLRDALERLAAQRELSQALRSLAQKAREAGDKGQSAAGEMLRQLADLLRALPQGRGAPGSQSKPGEQSTEQTLQSLLAALQQLKHGSPQQGSPGALVEGPGGSPGAPVMMQSFAGAPGADATTAGAADLPTGLPGSERDTGTTDSPFGKSSSDAVEKGTDLALRGQLGTGESLSQMLPNAGGDDSKASRRYKEIYDAMAPAAQDAITQENIPLGARFFIQRYFEAIRPQE